MTDYVLIATDGAATEHDGDPRPIVGCHGNGGQNLPGRRTRTADGTTTVRLIGCDCAVIMPEEHEPNPVATKVVARLGFSQPGFTFYGPIALLRVDGDGWDVPLTAEDVAYVREAAAVPAEAPAAGGHEHEFPVPEGYQDPTGRNPDMRLIGAFIGAAVDSCTTCQDAELTRLIEDAPSTARLVELACIAVHNSLGGLPDNMTNPKAPGTLGKAFRSLARAGLDGRNGAMFDACEKMPSSWRRDAANDAADIIVGQMAMGGR